LSPLKGHTVSDRHTGFADIEIYSSSGKPFEMVEVKHKIPIDETMIEDVLKKIGRSAIKRYFILTTAEPNFKGKQEDIFQLVRTIKARFGIDLIPNGIIPSLKYYLRLIPDQKEFIIKYTENLSINFKLSSEIKIEHISGWEEILKMYGLTGKK
jgi:DNA (cytosine-5)-methyltransferase 1